MKTTNQFLRTMAIVVLLCISTPSFAQEASNRPEYVVRTTLHWNMDMEDFDMATWKAGEKEYLEKVTRKNEYIMSSSVYVHQMTPDNTELLSVRAFRTWGDIEKASAKDAELEKAAWPDETARKAFLKKLASYYSHEHADEIYSTLPTAKAIPEGNTKDLILYIRTTHLAYPEDGDNNELKALWTESFDKLIKTNPIIKGYYPNRHAWGNDGTEIVEAIFLESLADMDKMFDSFEELSKKAWPDEAARKARGKKYDKYFTGVHGDAVYKLIAELSK
ncbi:hypothetical protein [Mariniflexile sp. AS56]|uniref:hypothetical protein n=1 Tax=Mariniflexile sp. AS56 TaxID=3063957 RepID=UPI0026ED5ACE|nr:hypothetical protein [Mariniflexile sp. AS56]MDO7170881.1 hypothetical protein [Mariniflexile sp. AS56]